MVINNRAHTLAVFVPPDVFLGVFSWFSSVFFSILCVVSHVRITARGRRRLLQLTLHHSAAE